MSAKTDMDTELEVEALAHERLRLHDQSALTSVAASLVAGGVLVPAIWGQTSRAGLVAWFLALLAVGGVRYAGRQAHLRAGQGSAVRSWLHRYQALFLLQGLVWLCLLPLLAQVPRGEGLDVATLVVTALVGGSLVTGAFDLRAASLFAWPTALPLFARLLGGGGPSEWLLAAASAVFIALMLGAARRTSRLFAQHATSAAQARERLAQAEAHARDAEAARRELSTVHERTEQLLRGTPLGYWFVDPQGRTLDVNPAMCDLLGRSREEVLKLGVFDCFTGAERAVLEAELVLRRQGKTGGYEIDIVRPDGTRRHTFNQATPIHDSQGLHTGSIGLWTDLTAQKNLEVELRTYERVTNSITDVVAVVDAQRNLCLVNDAWCSMVGVSRADVLGTPAASDALSLAEPERHAALEACFAQGKAGTVTVRSSWPDGRLALLQTQFHPYRDGGSATERVILVTRDISDQASDRLAAEVSAEYLRQTLNATGDAVFASDADDPDAPLSFANDPLLRMWDIEGKRPGTLTLNDVLEAAGRQFAEPGIELPRTREINEGSRRHQSRVRLRDGRVLHRRYEPAIVAGRRLRVWSFRDVTAEEQLLTLMQDRDAQQRALLDDLFYAIAQAVRTRLTGEERSHRDALDELNERLVDKYFVNFSVFESIPDVWAIDQVFPIVPIARLDEAPDRRGVIADLTCDSDGRIDTYVESEALDSSLPLHSPRNEMASYLMTSSEGGVTKQAGPAGMVSPESKRPLRRRMSSTRKFAERGRTSSTQPAVTKSCSDGVGKPWKLGS